MTKHHALAAYMWDGEPDDMPGPGEIVFAGYNGMRPVDKYETGQFVAIPYTSWGDYVGGTVERANYEALLEDMPDTFVEVRYDYDGHMLAIRPEQITDDIDEIIASLQDYPLYNEEAHSMLEMRLVEEAWDCYLRDDLRRDLDHAGVDTDELDWDAVRERYYTMTYEYNYGPECETATGSVHFPAHANIVEQLVTLYGTVGE